MLFYVLLHHFGILEMSMSGPLYSTKMKTLLHCLLWF